MPQTQPMMAIMTKS